MRCHKIIKLLPLCFVKIESTQVLKFWLYWNWTQRHCITILACCTKELFDTDSHGPCLTVLSQIICISLSTRVFSRGFSGNSIIVMNWWISVRHIKWLIHSKFYLFTFLWKVLVFFYTVDIQCVTLSLVLHNKYTRYYSYNILYFLQADPLQLKNFLTLIRKASLGENIDKINLSTLAPASNKSVDKPKTKMSVTSRKDYPLTKSFPSQLEYLHISQCRMKKIDSRIFQLKKLLHLDLRENVIEELPSTFSQLENLQELILCANKIQNLPLSLCLLPKWKQFLSLLDLSNNGITLLPIQLCELDNLVTLKVDQNKLETFPPTIGRLKRLKYLSASQNQIKTLPCSFMQLCLEHLDLYNNPFADDTNSDLEETEWQAPSLVECCARMIRKNR